MAIYVLKKDDFYIVSAMATLKNINGVWNIVSKIKFNTSKNITQARLIEDPNMDAVKKYGLVAVEVEASKPELKELGAILEHEM